MQDIESKSIRAPKASRQFDDWIASHHNWTKRQIGLVASLLFSSGPIGDPVVVSIVTIFLLRGIG